MIKYTEEGHVEIIASPADEDQVVIEIADTGVGMSEQELKKLGQKFYRAGNYVNEGDSTGLRVVRAGGTGLGLYVSFSLVRKMQGKIKVESAQGEGTKFTINMRAYQGQKEEKDKPMSVMEKFEQMKKNKADN